MKLLPLLALLVACGTAASTRGPQVPVPMPPDRAARTEAMNDFGRRLYRLLKRGEPQKVLFDDEAVGTLLDETNATRVRALRPGTTARLQIDPVRFRALENARFSGLCLQGARQESPGGPLGLQSEGWVFERALVVGTQPGGRRLASWVEGAFVYTESGFGALALTRVEAPRWEHSDLELTTCDMEVGLR